MILGIVLICYKNADEVLNYVNNELSKIASNYIISIVDNSCDIKEYKKLIDVFNHNESVLVIDAKSNLGYAKANNLGADYLINHYNVDYILFSNTDIVIQDADVCEYLTGKLDQNKGIGAINPGIKYTNGADLTPFRRINFNRRYIFYPIIKPLNKLLGIKDKSNIVFQAKEGIYYNLHGCFLMVNVENFCDAGMFDSNTFLYSEEEILSERLSNSNSVCYYAPDKHIIHVGEQNTSKFIETKRRRKLFLESHYYYFNTYRGVSKFQILLSIIVFFILYDVFWGLRNLLKKG